MRGHIRQRATRSWTIEASGGFDDAGRRVRISRTVRGTRRDAEKALTKLLREVDEGTVARSGDEAFGAYLLERWLPYMRSRVRAETWARYESIVRVQIAPRCGRLKLSALRPHHVQGVLDQMLSDGAAPASVVKAYNVMGGALRQAVRWQLISVSPAPGARPPRLERPELRVPDSAEMRTLVDAAVGTPWDIPVLLAATSGARRGEVCELVWRGVDLDAGTLTIERGKTSAARRTIHLPASTVTALRRHKKAQSERRLLVGEAWQDTDLVCDAGTGRTDQPGLALALDVYAAVLPGMGEQVASAIEAAFAASPAASRSRKNPG